MIDDSFRRSRAALQLSYASLIVVLSLAIPGCQQNQAKQDEQPSAAPMASTVHTGDPKSTAQLVSGFYDIEQNSWRWTKQQFSAVLHAPAGSAQSGATLVTRLTVPDSVIQSLKSITLSAKVGGASLAPETYSKPGQYIYTRDVAANLLTNETVQIDFQLDKSMAPAGSERRDLGIIVNVVGLDPK